MTRHVQIGLLRTAVGAADRLKVAADEVLAAAGVTEAELTEIDRFVPLERMIAAMQVLYRHADPDEIPLAMVRSLRLEHLGAPGFALMSAPTLREAVGRLDRYHRLASMDARTWLVDHADGALEIIITRDIPHPTLKRVALQAMPIVLTEIARALTGVHVTPQEVALPHMPGLRDRYEAFLGAPLQIAADARTHITLAAAAANLPIPQANPALLAYMDQRSEALLARLPCQDASPTTTARTRAMIQELLDGEAPTADSVATRLGMSRRTLYRRLREEGTSFQGVLDALRADMARALLGDGVDIAEVAFVLGFSEPRAFHRAFKRWVGATPAQWRDAQLP